MTRPTATAVVESPLQLLCAVEAHAAGHGDARTLVRARADVATLAATVSTVEALGLPDGLDAVVGPPPRRLPDGVVVVGDAFSGAFQSALVRAPRPPRRLVVVDDGLATLDLARRLVSSAPLVRPGTLPDPLRLGLGALAGRRLRRLARGGRVVLCTTLPLPAPLVTGLRALGVHVVTHGFEWLRSRPRPEAPAEDTVVVGSAFVADGLVHADRYAAWIRGIAADGPVRYLPHRRHDPLVTALLERLPGVTVDAPGAPVEVRLRGMRAGQRVVSLPSTSAITLTRLLAPAGVGVVPHAVPAEWWTGRVDDALREHLGTARDLALRARPAAPAPARLDPAGDGTLSPARA